MELFGGNAGRGGHPLAMRTSAALYSARETAADLFGASPENTVFTLNCTYALNMAIQGIMSGGGHLIISGRSLPFAYTKGYKGSSLYTCRECHRTDPALEGDSSALQ